MTTTRKQEPPFLRTPYNYDTNKAGDESGLKCEDPTLTRQSEAEEADINTIVSRFLKTGVLPDQPMPIYADYDDVYDFKTAMDAVARAHESFDRLDPKIRARFHNNPQELLEFCANDENRPEAEKMGLVNPKPKVNDEPTIPSSLENPKEPPKTPLEAPKDAPGAKAPPQSLAARRGPTRPVTSSKQLVYSRKCDTATAQL